MKKFLPRLLLLCLASVLLLAVTDWKNSHLPTPQTSGNIERIETADGIWKSSQLPAPQINGSIERIETADGITMTVDISGDVLQWRNAHAGESMNDVQWRKITLKGVYYKFANGEEAFELEEIFIEDLHSDLPGEPWIGMPETLNRGNTSFAFYVYDKNGKPLSQPIGEIFFSPEEEGFVITLWKDITPPDRESSVKTYTTGEILTYPAQSRKEAVDLTRRILYSNYDTQQLGIWK